MENPDEVEIDKVEMTTVQSVLVLWKRVIQSWELTLRAKGYRNANCYMAVCFTGSDVFFKIDPGFQVQPLRRSIDLATHRVGDAVLDIERYIHNLKPFDTATRAERIEQLQKQLAELQSKEGDE